MDALLQQEGYDLMAAAFEVYNRMGSGYLEEVYHQCLEHELRLRNIPYSSKPELEIRYKGVVLEKRYRPDLLVFEGIIVELKAVKALAPEHEAQLLGYLKASGKRVGYLLNFGSLDQLEWKRMVK
ncbi:MAG: GxxExxY protein [Acidobacteria bacterium]|nr:GxxExxY protein [Acidobacteriota bacterium]